MTDQPTKTLRGLARELGVAHSALSAAAHEGRLTAGIVLEHGRVRVVDAAAAAAQWRAFHVPRIDLAIRKQTAAQAAALATVVVDDDGLDWTVGQLLRWHAAHDRLALALVRDALDREDGDALIERIGAFLDDDIARGVLEAKVRQVLQPDEEDDDAGAA